MPASPARSSTLPPTHPPERLVFLRAISSNSWRPSGFSASAARSSYRSLRARAGGGDAVCKWAAMGLGEGSCQAASRAAGPRGSRTRCCRWGNGDGVSVPGLSVGRAGGRPRPAQVTAQPGWGVCSGKVLFSGGHRSPGGRRPRCFFRCHGGWLNAGAAASGARGPAACTYRPVLPCMLVQAQQRCRQAGAGTALTAWAPPSQRG